MAEVRFPAGTGDFSLLHYIHTGSGAHPAYLLSNGYQGPFPGGGCKAIGCEAYHSPPPRAEVKKGGPTPPLPNMFS
jgi:hypothetical protein